MMAMAKVGGELLPEAVFALGICSQYTSG